LRFNTKNNQKRKSKKRKKKKETENTALLFDNKHSIQIEETISSKLSFTSTSHFHCKTEHPGFRIAAVLLFVLTYLVGLSGFIFVVFFFLGSIPGAVFCGMLVLVNLILFKRYEKDAANALLIFFIVLMLLIGL
jgi:hypothetical protein